MYPLGSERGHNRIGMWGIITHENLFFYIFNEKFVKILWKQDCVMSDVQSSCQNSDGLALSSMGHKINIEII